jgi:membrane protein
MWLRLWAFLDRLFFGAASAGPDALAATLRILRYPYAVIRDLSRGQINLRAMGLVFTTLLSLVPLIAFAFAILKVFGAHRDLEPIVYEFFRPVGESAPDLTTRVMQFADRVSSGLVGAVGLALLLWTLLGTIKKVEDSFNFLWRVEVPRSFARRVAEYLGLLIVGPILLVGFIGLSHAALGSAPVQRVAELPLMQRLITIGLSFAPYLMVTAFFTALYMFIPNTRVQIRSALIGALVAGIVWAAVGKMFTAMVVYSSRLTIVYAGFAVIVAVLLWTYFGWLILLAGAQLSFYVQNPSYLRLGLEELKLSSVELEELALKVMYYVGHAHTTGRERWTINGLAAQLGLPALAISHVTSALERNDLLIVTENDELVPGRDIGRITLLELLHAVRNQRSGHFAPRGAPLPAVDRITMQLNDAWRNSCGTRTVRDMVEEGFESRTAVAAKSS